MAYIKNNWVDREGTTRYFETVDDDGALIFTPDYTQVTELGTPVNADNMNHIEEGIGNHEERITVLENLPDKYLDKSQITNCLLEVPQKIKLELVDGSLTLKAGSKYIFPNGAGVFEERTTTTDKTTVSTSNGQRFVCFTDTGSFTVVEGNVNTSSGSTDSLEGSTWHIWYDTTNNKVFRYRDNAITPEYQMSLPVALITVTNGVITSIDQVFNGFGYIGSTIWVDKGVKGLIPNSRNEDGSLKNIEFVTNKVLTKTMESNLSVPITCALDGAGNIIRANSTQYSYNSEQNQMYLFGEKREICMFVDFTTTNGVISNFQPKLPFRAVDYNDAKDYLKADRYDGQWVKKNIMLLVDGSATGGLTVAEGAYSATFDLSSYLPNDGHDYLVSVRIYSQNASTATAYNNFVVDGGYGRTAVGKVAGKSVFQDSSIIVPIDKNHKLYVENAPSSGTSTLVNIVLSNYRRIGTNN